MTIAATVAKVLLLLFATALLKQRHPAEFRGIANDADLASQAEHADLEEMWPFCPFWQFGAVPYK